MSKGLEQPFIYRMPVRFSDVDHVGIVYYPVFLHYFHIAFEEFFRAHMGQRAYVELLDKEKLGFPVVACQCSYRSPLRFGDTVELEMAAVKFGGKSITFRHRAFRAAEGNRDKILAAEGTVVCALVDLAEFHSIPATKEICEIFARIYSPARESS